MPGKTILFPSLRKKGEEELEKKRDCCYAKQGGGGDEKENREMRRWKIIIFFSPLPFFPLPPATPFIIISTLSFPLSLPPFRLFLSLPLPPPSLLLLASSHFLLQAKRKTGGGGGGERKLSAETLRRPLLTPSPPLSR